MFTLLRDLVLSKIYYDHDIPEKADFYYKEYLLLLSKRQDYIDRNRFDITVKTKDNDSFWSL